MSEKTWLNLRSACAPGSARNPAGGESQILSKKLSPALLMLLPFPYEHQQIDIFMGKDSQRFNAI
jgi:hypothetical protein